MIKSEAKIKTAIFGLLAVCLLIPLNGLAAQEWLTLLKSEPVTLQRGKMVWQEVGLVKIEIPGYDPAQFQVKLKSEAPAAGVISRDNFVALTTQVFTYIMIMALAEAYEVPASTFMNGFDYKKLSAPIGTQDMEINIIMTGEGLQIELVDTGSNERSRFTETWDNFFKK